MPCRHDQSTERLNGLAKTRSENFVMKRICRERMAHSNSITRWCGEVVWRVIRRPIWWNADLNFTESWKFLFFLKFIRLFAFYFSYFCYWITLCMFILLPYSLHWSENTAQALFGPVKISSFANLRFCLIPLRGWLFSCFFLVYFTRSNLPQNLHRHFCKIFVLKLAVSYKVNFEGFISRGITPSFIKIISVFLLINDLIGII